MQVGIVIGDGSGSLRVCVADLRKLPFKTTLVPVDRAVPNHTYEYIFYIGFLPRITTRELIPDAAMKRRDLLDFVRMNFVQDLPVEADSVWWQFRELAGETHKVRAAAIDKNEYSKITEILAANEIKIDDFILAPLLLSEDIFEGISDYDESDIDSFHEYILKHCASDFHIFSTGIDPDKTLSLRQHLTLFAAIQFLEKSKESRKIYSCPDMVPSELVPVRCRTMARINHIALIITAVLCMAALFSHFRESYDKYSQIENENRELSKKLGILQKQNMQANLQRQLLKRYIEQRAGISNLEFVIQELTQRIPSYMWVTTFRLSNQIIDLNISSSKDDSNFYATMNGGRLYILKNLSKNNKRSQKTDSIDYTVKIELK